MTERDFAVKLAQAAGKTMLKNFSLGMKKQWKEDNSPVTATDHAINQMVIEEIKKAYPDMSILGEEASHMIEGSEYTWVCDPIDGTVPFAYGVPTSVFELALVKDGEPILGIIYDPFLDRLFEAQKGQGALLNGQPIHVSDAKSFKLNIAGAGEPSMIAALYENGARAMNVLSIAYVSALVASGELVAAIAYTWAGPWDIAAVKLIVEEAGGTVTSLDGKEQRYDQKINGAAISNGYLHESLLEIIKAKNKG